MTIVCDVTKGVVEHVAKDRKMSSLRAYFDRFSSEELANIRGVAMDTWGPYIQATLACVPDAGSKIVFDRFHIMQYVGEAVDQVRREEHAALSARGNDTLKGTRFLWLYSEENLPDRHRPTLEAMKSLLLRLRWCEQLNDDREDPRTPSPLRCLGRAARNRQAGG